MLLSFWFNILNKTGFSASHKSDRFRFKLESLGCTLRFKSGIIAILFPSFPIFETKLRFFSKLFPRRKKVSQFYLELLKTVIKKLGYFSKSLDFPEFMNSISKDSKSESLTWSSFITLHFKCATRKSYLNQYLTMHTVTPSAKKYRHIRNWTYIGSHLVCTKTSQITGCQRQKEVCTTI